jgi:ABC-type uncharacterized transport system substrate-binding protein
MMRQRIRNGSKRLGPLLAVLLSAGLSMFAHAAPDSVVLILSDESAPYQEFANRFRATVDGRGIRVSVINASQLAPGGAAASTSPGVAIPVGVRATEATLRSATTAPVLAALIPRAAYAQLKKTAGSHDQPFSAIYLDQPWLRRFALISDALPDRKRVGVVLGPESAGELRALQTAAHDKGLSLVSERIADGDELLPALKRVLGESDVLLAVPDPLVLNKGTAQSVLLTSYRAQNPLVGYSQSYVQAGALMAVYSTPAQRGQQAAELVLQLFRSGTVTLPAPQFPKYFSISVNSQVARSMGIAIDAENVLHDRLLTTGGQE